MVIRPFGRIFWVAVAVVAPGLCVQDAQAFPQAVGTRLSSTGPKTPLAWRDATGNHLLNMRRLPPELDSAGHAVNWSLQTMIRDDGDSIGQTSGRGSGWRAYARIDSFPARNAFKEGVKSLDWGDGSFVRLRYQRPDRPSYTFTTSRGVRTQLRNGDILYATRVNTIHTAPNENNHPAGTIYRIMVFVSQDDGRSWTAHTTVASSYVPEGSNDLRGLWSNFLLEKQNGEIQIYFDDQDSPFRAGAERESWITMRKLRQGSADQPLQFSSEVIVVNVPKPKAHDGMPSVSEGAPNKLFLTMESVAPGVRGGKHTVIRAVRSDDSENRVWRDVNPNDGIIFDFTVEDEPGVFSSYNALAPAHYRNSRDNGLYLVMRTDMTRAGALGFTSCEGTDSCTTLYEPERALRLAARQDPLRACYFSNPRWIQGTIALYRSLDDGKNWYYEGVPDGDSGAPDGTYWDGETHLDPGVTEDRTDPGIKPGPNLTVVQYPAVIPGSGTCDKAAGNRLWVETLRY